MTPGTVLTQSHQKNSTRNRLLLRLDGLVGTWDMQALVGGQIVGRSISRFEWLDGGSLLVQRVEGGPSEDAPPQWLANSPLPLTTITGLDETSETLYMLYADSRGVSRVYQMSIFDGVWMVWREAPGFHQRFTGTFSGDGNAITGFWEGSKDGVNWELDFNVTYRKK